jgi:hypothetical protein
MVQFEIVAIPRLKSYARLGFSVFMVESVTMAMITPLSYALIYQRKRLAYVLVGCGTQGKGIGSSCLVISTISIVLLLRHGFEFNNRTTQKLQRQATH